MDKQAVVNFGVGEGPQHDVLRDRPVEGRKQQRDPDRSEDPDASAPVAVENDRRRDQEDDNDLPQMCSTTKWRGICFTWIIW